jgi:hypothetical protein
VRRMGWTAANGMRDGYRFKETGDLIRLLAHRFGSFHIILSARFAFGC